MALLVRVLWLLKSLLSFLVVIGVFFNGKLQLESDGLGLFILVGGGIWGLSSFLVGWRIVFYDKVSVIFVGLYCVLLGAFFSVFMYGKVIDFFDGMSGSVKYISIYFWPWALCVSTFVYLVVRKRVSDKQ